jgi:signal transduction histidine kinase
LTFIKERYNNKGNNMNYGLSMFKQLYLKFSPKGVLDPDDINHWKEKILYTFIFISVFLIVIMGLANFPYLIKQNYWGIISTITISYLGCLIMFFFSTISYKKRATAVSFFIYAIGISIIFSVGPFVAPREYLFFFSIVTSILLGWPGAIVSIITNTFTLISIGILLKIGFWKDLFVPTDPLNLWFQTSTDLFFINVCTILFVTFLFQNIEKSDHKAKTNSKLLLLEKINLIDSKNKLEEEFKERKGAEAEKLIAQKIAGEQKKLALVGQVAGKITHDFNNILGIVMGNTELALLDCQEPKIKKILELIFEQTIRGKNLTKNLVAFAKDQEPKQEFFRISEKIELVLNLMRKDLKEIELIKEDKPGVPELLADPGMIEHALINLMQNSIHATSMNESPRIIVRTYSLDNKICFEIEDNGCGISKENLENIYEPSFTLKGSRDVTGSYKSGIKGTGYGMANVKKYVEQHKGSISIESEVGVGATFTICLPIIKKELTTKEKAELKKEITQFEKYILLVEDETAISDVQYRILTSEPCNHKVDVAHNGQMAKDLFERNTYDFVSLDYVLPGGINGMDVYHHIRKTNQTVPVLFISGNIEFLESIKELKQKDTNIDHLSKPCQNKDYVNGINELLEKTLAEQ